MFWGSTPALDFQETYKNHFRPAEEFNILIYGGTDARHILKTISQLYRHENVKVNFYIMEACVELIARQLLLLNIALEPPENLGLMLKTKTFMELYGNILIRPSVANYLSGKSKQMVDMITDFEYCSGVMKLVNLNSLKYKERDYLEMLLKFWATPEPFLICELWDRRLRQGLGVRYDSRMGAFDWDLHMRLHPAGATQICTQEYKHWRETGVAFTWLESEVSKPNRTLVAGVVQSGETFLHHGYVGDVNSGPFMAYGLQCKDKELLKKVNHMNVNRATDIIEYNLMQMFYEIENKEECIYKNLPNLKLGTVVVDLPNKRIVENDAQYSETQQKNINDKCIDIENVTVNFLSPTMFERISSKEQYKKCFNVIYFSNLVIDKIDSGIINKISAENCLLVVENQNYLPASNRKEQLDDHYKKITKNIESIENVSEIPFDHQKDCYAMFSIINSK